MVTRGQHRRQRGSLTAEVAVALAVMLTVLLPFAAKLAQDRVEGRKLYQRAIAIQIVDGEMEVLAAGGWREFAIGEHPYTVNAGAAINLPEGKFVLTRTAESLRLEWQPDARFNQKPVMREMTLQ